MLTLAYFYVMITLKMTKTKIKFLGVPKTNDYGIYNKVYVILLYITYKYLR